MTPLYRSSNSTYCILHSPYASASYNTPQLAHWIYIVFTMAMLSTDMEEVSYHQGTHCTMAVSLGSIRQVFKSDPLHSFR